MVLLRAGTGTTGTDSTELLELVFTRAVALLVSSTIVDNSSFLSSCLSSCVSSCLSMGLSWISIGVGGVVVVVVTVTVSASASVSVSVSAGGARVVILGWGENAAIYHSQYNVQGKYREYRNTGNTGNTGNTERIQGRGGLGNGFRFWRSGCGLIIIKKIITSRRERGVVGTSR